MQPSSWNSDRSELSRAVRRAQRFAFNRNSGITTLSSDLYYPLVCHVLPLGRLPSYTNEDWLALHGNDVGKLVPPQFTHLHTRFGANAVEFINNPVARSADRDIWLTWFRTGGVELRARATKAGVSLLQLIDDVIPSLGRITCSVQSITPPIFVSLTIAGALGRFEPPSQQPDTRTAEIAPTVRTVLPPLVIHDAEEFNAGWPRHTQVLLNQFAQTCGFPTFERARWRESYRH